MKALLIRRDGLIGWLDSIPVFPTHGRCDGYDTVKVGRSQWVPVGLRRAEERTDLEARALTLRNPRKWERAHAMVVTRTYSLLKIANGPDFLLYVEDLYV